MNRMRRRIACFLALWCLALCACTPMVARSPVTTALLDSTPTLVELTAAQKAQDWDALLAAMRESYPYFGVRERLDGKRWLDEADAYRQRLERTPDNASFLRELGRALRDLGDGHTNVIAPEDYDNYRWVYQEASGHAPWREVLNAPAIAEKNVAWLKLLHREAATEYLQADERAQEINDAADSSSGLSMRMLGEDAALIRIPTFGMPYVLSDGKALRAFYRTIADRPYLVIDIRDNGGGSDEYWMNNIVAALAREPLEHTAYLLYRNNPTDKAFTRSATYRPRPIRDLPSGLDLPPEARSDFALFEENRRRVAPRDSVAYRGRIVLLVNGRVFSASESFANFAKYTGFATLVGERTGGDGIGIDPMIVSLPNSGLVVRFPFVMGLNPDGTANAEACTPPDVEADAGATAEELLEMVKAGERGRKAG